MSRDELQRLADEDLMTLVGDKDADAFAVFYDRHAGSAYSLAYRIVGERAAAEDATQEALISIWKSGARYDRTRGSVRSWALGIVRNRAIDSLRREGGRPKKIPVGSDEILERRPAKELTDIEAARRETSRQLRGALEELPSEQSKVIELAYFGGFTHSQIAEMLEMPLGTVKGRMRLGMDKMRSNLAEALS